MHRFSFRNFDTLDNWKFVKILLAILLPDCILLFLQGDSGGPLVYNNTLVGIVAWVIPRSQGLPDGFTRISYYVDFINDTVKKRTLMVTS